MVKRIFTGVAAFLAIFSVTSRSQMPDISAIINDPNNQDAVVSSIDGNHELIMKLIDKLSEHPHFVQLMKSRFGTDSSARSPYAGEETRTVSALSDDQIRQYLNGEGMGFAMPAELNGYPGPRHVLDLAGQLHLSAPVREKISGVFAAMHAQAVRVGRQIVGKERLLDTLFKSGQMKTAEMKKVVEEIGRLQGEYRWTHLNAHLSVTPLLSAEQVGTYKKLRGYGMGGMSHEHHD